MGQMPRPSVVIVGGGAAGVFAALRAKEVNPLLSVTLLEAASKPLGKVKISGGGRCNVTTSCMDVSRLVQYYPRGQKELKGVFSRFGPKDTVAWFESRGVRLKTEPDGRMFPVTDDSQTIIDCLLEDARRHHVSIITKARVKTLRRHADHFVVQTPEHQYNAQAVLMASGSSQAGYSVVTALGHKIIPPVPSLFTFTIKDPRLSGLAGISFPHVKGTLDVPGSKPIVQEGPLLITHWGLSGPVILRLSAWGARGLYDLNYRAQLWIDFCPDTDQASLQKTLLETKASAAKKQMVNFCPVELPKRFWERLLESLDIAPELVWGAVPQKSLNRLSETLKRCGFQIQGKGEFKEEFVTAGGVPLSEIDMKTMASRICPGLYLAGEIIDVDALTGGFNFQNAWATGWIAGGAIAESLKSP